jgi:predicted nucleic acid-binding protein
MLIDTSGFLCLIHKDEPEHSQAVSIYTKAHSYLTHSYILDEFIPLARVRKLPRSESLMFSRQILHDNTIEVVWVDEVLHKSALSLLENRRDKSYSLCDAVSFVLMQERGVTGALTTDKHFEQEGFVRLLK